MSSSSYTDTVGDDNIFYSPSAVDDLVTTINLLHDDFERYLDDIQSADGVFDSVIFPYSKGCPPSNKRFVKRRGEYDAQLEDAKKSFDDSLTQIINSIIDYSHNTEFTLSSEVATTDNVLESADRFVVKDSSDVETLGDSEVNE